jgi:hypothetical protein
LPLRVHELFPTHAGFQGAVTSAEIRAVARNREVRLINTSQPASLSTWERLDAELFSRRPDLSLRVSGSEYDLTFLARLKNVRHFCADGYDVTGLESIAALQRLESLALRVFHLESFEFLRTIPARHLKSLSLRRTRSTKPSLAPLAHFANLRKVYIEGHHKEIEVIGRLPKLEDLTLRSVTTSGMEYLRPLSHLRSLDIKLGGTKDLSAISGMKSIRYLEIWQVKGLTELDVAGQLSGLQYLFLQSLLHVGRLPSFARSRALRRVHLQNMRGLKDVSSLVSAPSLEELVIFEGERQSPDALEPVLAMRTLKRASCAFGSKQKNARFAELRAKHGVLPLKSPFRFR